MTEEEFYPCAGCHSVPVLTPGDLCDACEDKRHTCLSCGAAKEPDHDHCDACQEVIEIHDVDHLKKTKHGKAQQG